MHTFASIPHGVVCPSPHHGNGDSFRCPADCIGYSHTSLRRRAADRLSVLIKGTSQGTMTDIDGNYTLKRKCHEYCQRDRFDL